MASSSSLLNVDLSARYQLLQQIMTALHEVNGADRGNGVRTEKRNYFLEAIRGILALGGINSMPISTGTDAITFNNFITHSVGGALNAISDPIVLAKAIEYWNINYIFMTGYFDPTSAGSDTGPEYPPGQRDGSHTDASPSRCSSQVFITHGQIYDHAEVNRAKINTARSPPQRLS